MQDKYRQVCRVAFWQDVLDRAQVQTYHYQRQWRIHGERDLSADDEAAWDRWHKLEKFAAKRLRIAQDTRDYSEGRW